MQSGNDELNTHFIGHNSGVFSIMFSLKQGDNLSITDAAGNATNYEVRTILTLDDYGKEISDQVDYWESVVGTGGGERVTLQTCINDTTNLVVFAYSH